MPETGTNTYHIQYGRKLNWSGAASQVTSLRVPAGLFTSVTLQALVSDLPSNASLALDIGNTDNNSWSTTVSNGGDPTSPNLAAFFNAYWASHGAPTTGTLDVPIRVYLDRAGQVLLTNLQVTPTGSKARAIRLPVRPLGYSSVAASFTVSGGSGPLAVGVDVGGDGTIDWTYTGAPAYPAALTTGNLATAVNAYLASVGGQPSADVPLRFHLAPFATLALTGFTATPAGGSDASIGAGDITFSAAAPTEGNEVTVSATIHNTGTLDTGPLVVAFYATPPGQPETQIGSAFVPNVAAAGTETVPLQWHTLGFTGDVAMRAVVDPFNRLAEADEDNNAVAATLPIKTRPDLRVATIALSDAEPVVGQAVTVTLTLHNDGQTAAGPARLALYDDQPDGSRAVACEDDGGVPANATRTITCQWTPAAAGAHRLFAQADRDRAVNESNEGNNDKWLNVYVGFAGPILLDSGAITEDRPYSATLGYGAVDEGQPDVLSACSPAASPADTFRRDPAGRVVYRFDHLLPGHFYHLDTTLYECDGAHRQETVKADGNALLGPVDLSDGQAHRFSTRLDPALYADRAISVSVEAPGINGAVVSQVNLYDIDYRYADAGAGGDLAYAADRGYGWLDGVPNSAWGGLPYQNVRVNQAGNTLRYRFDSLAAAKRYQVNLTLYQGDAVNVIEEVLVDGLATGVVANLSDRQPHYLAVDVPVEAYREDGSIVVTVRRTNGAIGAFVNEIALEEKTLLNQPAMRDVQITNVSAERATISWVTDAATDGAVHYGATTGLGAISLDERGTPLTSRTHQVNLTGLAPETAYYFYAISADAIDDNAGAYYRFTTGPAFGPNPSDLVFGRVLRADGTTPAAGALVRARLRDADAQGSAGDAAPLSALVDSGGYWSFDLAAARTPDHSQLFEYSPTDDQLMLDITDGSSCTASQSVDTGHDAPAADIILVCPTQVAHSIANGWTLLGLSVEADIAPTAEAALNDIVAQGGSAQEIERWWNGGWDAHVRGLPFNNFTLVLGKGYFVRAGAASGWVRTGRPLVSPPPVGLYPGWNLVSFPKLPTTLLAEDLLVGIAAQGGACSEVDRWVSGAWMGHIKGYTFNNFPLMQTEGYFIKCTKQSTYTPPTTALNSLAQAPAAEEITAQPALAPTIYDVLVTNRRDVAFTVSWRTDQPSKGWVEYGQPGQLGLIARDDAGAISTLHHVTVANLAPETAYAFRVHAGDQIADQGGQPFQITTAATTPPSVPLTAFGQVQTADGQPAVGALTRVWLEDSAGGRSEPLSTLTESEGYWALSLPAEACADQQLLLQVFGPDGATAQYSGPACEVQPAPTLTLQAPPRRPIYLPMIEQ